MDLFLHSFPIPVQLCKMLGQLARRAAAITTGVSSTFIKVISNGFQCSSAVCLLCRNILSETTESFMIQGLHAGDMKKGIVYEAFMDMVYIPVGNVY